MPAKKYETERRLHPEGRNFKKGDIFIPVTLEDFIELPAEDKKNLGYKTIKDFDTEELKKAIDIHNMVYEGFIFDTYANTVQSLVTLSEKGNITSLWIKDKTGVKKVVSAGFKKEKWMVQKNWTERQARKKNHRSKYTATKIRGIEHDLPGDIHIKLVDKECFYCGIFPETGDVLQMDRVDSKKGYIIDNIVPACAPCNQVKGEKGPEFPYEHAKRIIKFTESCTLTFDERHKNLIRELENG